MHSLLIVFFTVISLLWAVDSKANSAELPLYSLVYDESRNPFQDARDALSLAKQTNRHVLIEIGGNWCTWCHKMDAFLEENPAIYQQLHQTFVVLKVNVSDDNENADFMQGLPPVLGYPHMYVSNKNGKMLLSKDTAELQENGQYHIGNWLSFLAPWQAANKAAPEYASTPINRQNAYSQTASVENDTHRASPQGN
ncbi:DUF255 domain-containing protein [Colwellia sp. MEBiC06753]